MSTFANESSLEPYEWKNRLIIYAATDESYDEVQKEIKANLEAIEDRNLLFFRLGETSELPFHENLSDEEQSSISEQFGIDPDEASTVFVLVGKDGGEKARQEEKLDLKDFFALIDTMPMRKREMRID